MASFQMERPCQDDHRHVLRRGLEDRMDRRALTGRSQGNWYPAATMFRKEFNAGAGLASAKAFVCGLGWFEMRLNGAKVGEDYFVPCFTDYAMRRTGNSA